MVRLLVRVIMMEAETKLKEKREVEDSLLIKIKALKKVTARKKENLATKLTNLEING
jgi:hypothetical protein